MTNLNDRKNYSDPTPNENRVSGVTGTNETNIRTGTTPDQAAYRDGYVHGRSLEQERLEVDREVRDNDNAARGLLLGILLTGLVGLTVGATYFLSQRNQAPVPNSTIVVPKSSPAPAQSPQIIERDRIVPVPVPQQQAPAPNVNITVPDTTGSQAPAAQPAPVTPSIPTQPAPPSAPAAEQPQPAAPSGSSTAPSSAPSSPSGTSPSGTNSGQ